MAFRDLSDLPTATRPEGEPPVEHAAFAPVLAEAWMATVDTTPKPTATGSPLRCSQAGFCSRSVQYDLMGVEREPLTVADHWRMGLGTILHERWQSVMAQRFPGCQSEVVVDLGQISGSADLVIDWSLGDDKGRTVLELKSMGGYGMKMSIGARGPAEGPRMGHKLQGALYAYGLKADALVIVYLALENLSPRELAKLGTEEWRRFAAEWHYGPEQFVPWAEAEKARLERVLDWTNEGKLVPRMNPEMPAGARITDPRKGTWQQVNGDGQVVNAGSHWSCSYCSYAERCVSDGATGTTTATTPAEREVGGGTDAG